MILIVGGSYQGKLDHARSRFNLDETDIQRCDENTVALDHSRRCVAYIDRFVLNRLRAGEDPVEIVRRDLDALSDRVVIANDISGGVVPTDPTLRAWREACGRVNSLLAMHADEVWRVFCGIPQRLK